MKTTERLEIDSNFDQKIDKRKYGRVTSCEINKIFKSSGDIDVIIYINCKEFLGTLCDISSSGISINTNFIIPDEFFIGIKFKIYDVSFIVKDFQFNATANELWRIENSDSSYKYGIKFNKLDERNFDFLRNLYILKNNLKFDKLK